MRFYHAGIKPGIERGISSAVERPGLEAFGPPRPGHQPVFVHHHRVHAGDPLHTREQAECFRHDAQRPRREHVIGVQPAHDLAGGAGEPFLYGIHVAAIGMAAPSGQPVRIPADDIRAAVGGSAVHHEILEIRIRLIENGADGGIQKPGLIVRRGHDGEFHGSFFPGSACMQSLIPRRSINILLAIKPQPEP